MAAKSSALAELEVDDLGVVALLASEGVNLMGGLALLLLVMATNASLGLFLAIQRETRDHIHALIQRDQCQHTYHIGNCDQGSRLLMDPVTTYQLALRDLTFNSKPIINNLTILAGQNAPVAPAIVQVLLTHLDRCPLGAKVPCLYLIDSIMKNIGEPYLHLFAQPSMADLFNRCIQLDVSLERDFARVLLTWRGLLPDPFVQDLINRLKEAGKDPQLLASRPPLTVSVQSAVHHAAPQAMPHAPAGIHHAQPSIRHAHSPHQVNQVQVSPSAARILNDLKHAATRIPPHYDGERVASLIGHLRRIDIDQRFVNRIDELARMPHKQPLVDLIERATNTRTSNARKRSRSPSQPRQVKRQPSYDHVHSPKYEHVHSPTYEHVLSPELSQSLPDLLSVLSKSLPVTADSYIPLRYEEMVKPRPQLHSLLYGQLRPLQCKQCGMRWKEGEREAMESHLDAHFRRNMRLKDRSKKVLAREWYPAAPDWIAGVSAQMPAEDVNVFEHAESVAQIKETPPLQPVRELRVPVGDGQTELSCVVCGEGLAVAWDDESEQWMYRNATRNTAGQVCHASCID